jgi:hypothetical protein
VGHAGGFTSGVFILGRGVSRVRVRVRIKKAPANAGAFFLPTVAQLKLCVDYWMVRFTLADPVGVVVSGKVVLPVTVSASGPLDEAEVLESPR